MPVSHTAGRATSRLLLDNSYLTETEPPDLEKVWHQTWVGQASWGIGPDYCSDCAFWNDAGGKHGKSPETRACQKFHQLMNRRGRRIPADALACRFFEMSDDAKDRQVLLETF